MVSTIPEANMYYLFVQTLLDRANRRDKIRVVGDQYRNIVSIAECPSKKVRYDRGINSLLYRSRNILITVRAVIHLGPPINGAARNVCWHALLPTVENPKHTRLCPYTA